MATSRTANRHYVKFQDRADTGSSAARVDWPNPLRLSPSRLRGTNTAPILPSSRRKARRWLISAMALSDRPALRRSAARGETRTAYWSAIVAMSCLRGRRSPDTAVAYIRVRPQCTVKCNVRYYYWITNFVAGLAASDGCNIGIVAGSLQSRRTLGPPTARTEPVQRSK